MGGLTGKDIVFAIENCPPELAAVIIICILVAVITYKVNGLVTAWQQEVEEAKILKKQLHKLIQLVTAAPCVSKNNGVWLGDETRNGGQPPEPIKCLYQEAKGQVGK